MKTTVTYTNGTEKEYDVIHADRVRGELEAHRRGLPSIQEAPMTLISVQVFAAALRIDPEETAGDFDQWIETVSDLKIDEAKAVDPHQATAL